MSPSQIEQIELILSTYGFTDQKAQAIEELLELAVVLQKSRRKSENTKALIKEIYSEIADVAIMLEQLFIIYDRHLIEEQIIYKLKRQMSRINS